jgi:hypothetical protein
MSRFLNRFFRAAKLDVNLYQEIVGDAGATNQALIVVFIYSMAAAYGTFGRAGVTGTNIGMITTLLGWYVWAFSTYMVGARFFPEPQTKPDRKTLMRALGVSIIGWIIRPRINTNFHEFLINPSKFQSNTLLQFSNNPLQPACAVFWGGLIRHQLPCR